MLAMRFSRFSTLVERISKNMKKIKDSVMEEFGLRSSHVMILFNLRQHNGGLTLTEIAKACGVNKAFVSRVAAELLSGAYIEHSSETDRQYKKKYVLTKKGVLITDRIDEKIGSVLRNVDKDITPEKLAVFNEVLALLDRNIKEFS